MSVSQMMTLQAPRGCRISSRQAARVRASASSTPAELVSTTVLLPRLQDAPRGRMSKIIDGKTLNVRYKATTKVVSVTDADSGMTYPVVIGSDQVVRYDPGHPTPAPPTGGLDNVASALKLGTFSEAVEVINIRAAMVGVLGVVLEELGSGRSFWAQLFSGSLFSAIAVMGFVTVASVAPFVAGVVDGDELFPREDNPFTDERLPEFWTPTAEKVNGRLAAAGLGLLMVQELMKGGAQL